MIESNGVCGAAVGSESIILLARLVGNAGLEIGPEDLAAIEYSIYSVDAHRRFRTAVFSQLAVPLDVRGVVLDSLRRDRVWKVDDVGYNFRHEIALAEQAISPWGPDHIDIEYVLTPSQGGKVRLRFQLKEI